MREKQNNKGNTKGSAITPLGNTHFWKQGKNIVRTAASRGMEKEKWMIYPLAEKREKREFVV